MATTGTIPPPVSWAQRNDLLYVIIDVECKDIDYKVTDNCFHFKGVNALEANRKYEVTLTFLHPVDPERVTSKNIGRCLEFTIYKKQSGPFWPSLTGDKNKLHFLKANFSKWKNESDDEDDGLMGGSQHDNSSFDWKSKFDDFNVDDDDSDDNIPSLSQNDDDENDDDKKEDKNDDIEEKISEKK